MLPCATVVKAVAVVVLPGNAACLAALAMVPATRPAAHPDVAAPPAASSGLHVVAAPQLPHAANLVHLGAGLQQRNSIGHTGAGVHVHNVSAEGSACYEHLGTPTKTKGQQCLNVTQTAGASYCGHCHHHYHHHKSQAHTAEAQSPRSTHAALGQAICDAGRLPACPR